MVSPFFTRKGDDHLVIVIVSKVMIFFQSSSITTRKLSPFQVISFAQCSCQFGRKKYLDWGCNPLDDITRGDRPHPSLATTTEMNQAARAWTLTFSCWKWGGRNVEKLFGLMSGKRPRTEMSAKNIRVETCRLERPGNTWGMSREYLQNSNAGLQDYT